MNNVSTNTFSSNSGTCVAKKNMSLNTLDTSLVGYWDMETLTGGLLKDLSGNGNDGSFSGGMVASTALTGGVLGKGMSFNGGGNTIIVGKNGLKGTEGTVSSLVKLNVVTNAITTIFDFAGTGWSGAILVATTDK
jgi:hypothetical protein